MIAGIAIATPNRQETYRIPLQHCLVRAPAPPSGGTRPVGWMDAPLFL